MAAAPQNPLAGIKALTFDVFGTVVNYQASVSAEVLAKSDGVLSKEQAQEFTYEWRQGYYRRMKAGSQSGDGPTNVDLAHRELLEELLGDVKWSELGSIWRTEEQRHDMVLVWHRLHGANNNSPIYSGVTYSHASDGIGWPDSSPGLYELKKHVIIATLSNGNVRLLVDMVCH